MTFKDFDQYQSSLLSEVTGMSTTKGKEYAHDLDGFANFNRLAKELDISNLMVAWIYTKKHLDAIASYIKEGKEFSSEGIRGRIVDAVTYLTLIGGMIEEGLNEGGKPQEIASNLDHQKCAWCGSEFLSRQMVFKIAGEFRHYPDCTHPNTTDIEIKTLGK